MKVYGLNTQTEKTTCYICGQELPLDNAFPVLQTTINDKGKDQKFLVFLCGLCDKRRRNS